MKYAIEILSRLWAKTKRKDQNIWHPLMYHLLDTGNICRELITNPNTRWHRVIPDVLYNDPTKSCEWLILPVASHDIGKASPPFQALSKIQFARVKGSGLFNFGSEALTSLDTKHELVSQLHVETTGMSIWQPDSEWAAILSNSVGGHHRLMTTPADLMLARSYLLDEPKEWIDIRSSMLEWLIKGFRLTPNLFPIERPVNVSTATILITGIIQLCDWLASDDHNFPLSSNVPLNEYIALSKERAKVAIAAHDLDKPDFSDAPIEFSKLFAGGKYSKVRPLQKAVDEIPDKYFQKPCIVIVEANMGEGKTEASQALAHRRAIHSGTDSFYCALPTMATGNAMYDRGYRFIEKNLNLKVNPRLAHSMSGEHPTYAQIIEKNKERELWFLDKKRTFAAPFGFGTIDQIEMAGLNSAYYPLRLACLAGKTIILDEVHAYDEFQTVIVDRMLTMLASFKCSVIILTATLPSRRRKILMEAFGVDTSKETKQDSLNRDYPIIWIGNPGDPIHHKAKPTPKNPRRCTHIEPMFLATDDYDSRARELVDQAKKGGRIAYVANFVFRAQETYKAVEALLKKEGLDLDVTLIHSRYPVIRRGAIENKLTSEYGPEAVEARDWQNAKGAIVIGTQVIEQSLDIDFDMMITDLAPIDLILQRSGRLHRHNPVRPLRRKRPFQLTILKVIIPQKIGNEIGFNLNLDGLIYPMYILMKTMEVLGTLPNHKLHIYDIRRLIEYVYGDEPPKSGFETFAFNEMMKMRTEVSQLAKRFLLPDPNPDYFDLNVYEVVPEVGVEGDEEGGESPKTRNIKDTIEIVPVILDGNGNLHIPNYPHLINIHQTASKEDVKAIRQRVIRVQGGSAVAIKKWYDAEQPTPLFQQKELMYLTPVWLDENNTSRVFAGRSNNYQLYLDEMELGLVINREKQKKLGDIPLA